VIRCRTSVCVCECVSNITTTTNLNNTKVVDVVFMDLPPENGPGCSSQHYQPPIMQSPTNNVQVFPSTCVALDQTTHTDQQCPSSHTFQQGQSAIPRSPQPLDLSSLTFQTDTDVLPMQHQPCISGRASAPQALPITPHVHRMSSSIEDDEGLSPPKNGWQNVSSSKRRKLHSSTARTETIQLHNKYSVLATPSEEPTIVRQSTTPRDPTPPPPYICLWGNKLFRND